MYRYQAAKKQVLHSKVLSFTVGSSPFLGISHLRRCAWWDLYLSFANVLLNNQCEANHECDSLIAFWGAPEVADVYLRWKIGPKVDIFALGPGAKGAKASRLVKAIAYRLLYIFLNASLIMLPRFGQSPPY